MHVLIQRGSSEVGWKWGTTSSLPKPLSLSWKPWQRAHTQESAKTPAPLKPSPPKEALQSRRFTPSKHTERRRQPVPDDNFRSTRGRRQRRCSDGHNRREIYTVSDAPKWLRIIHKQAHTCVEDLSILSDRKEMLWGCVDFHFNHPYLSDLLTQSESPTSLPPL